MKKNPIMDEILSESGETQPYCQGCRISDEELGVVALPGNCIQDCVVPAQQISDEVLSGAAWAGNNGPYSSCTPPAPLKAQAQCATPCRISDEDLSAASAVRQCLGCASCTTSDDEDLSGAAMAGNNSCSRCTAYVD